MSDPNDSTSISTVDVGRALLSPKFLDFCDKVRNNDRSILPEPGQPFGIGDLSEREDIELADALLENTNITFLKLETEKYTKSSAEAMAKYVRTSKRLQRIRWNGKYLQREDIICCFLPAFQESTSLKGLHIDFPLIAGPSNLALENMLTHTQSLQSLSLSCLDGNLQNLALAAAASGLKKNTTLRVLRLSFSQGATNVSPIITSVRDHPLLQRLCLNGDVSDLTGLETVLLSDTNITELDIHRYNLSFSMIGLTSVLKALARRPTLTKLRLHYCPLSSSFEETLWLALCNIPSLQTLVLTDVTLRSAAGLTELAPALYHNTSIKVLDISKNGLDDMESARSLRGILCSNKTMTALDLSGNQFGLSTGAVECIADGLGSNSTLLKIDLSSCALGDAGVSVLAQTLGSRNTTLYKLSLDDNSITSTGVGVLVETMEQSSHHITELDLQGNSIGNKGASLLARSLGNNALPSLTRVSLYDCGIGDDGFKTLVSALEQNTSLLFLDLRNNRGFGKRAFLALAESLPEIKVLQRVYFSWSTGLGAAMPLLLVGLRENKSLFRFHVAGCAPRRAPPTTEETAKCAGGWMQEMERLGYRNRFRPLIRAPEESLPPRGVWTRALARVATLPDVIFEVLRSKPRLVPSEDEEGKERITDSGKRKRGDE
jgi:Ran GTPase-activating protein (RanGAP) involved in mRNA processing and transport